MIIFLSQGFCPSIPTGLYGAGLTGYMRFQQNRNIKGELARASVFVFLKGTTAPTGFLGWRDVRWEGVGRSPSPYSPLSLHYHAFCPSLCTSAHLWSGAGRWAAGPRSTRWVSSHWAVRGGGRLGPFHANYYIKLMLIHRQNKQIHICIKTWFTVGAKVRRKANLLMFL